MKEAKLALSTSKVRYIHKYAHVSKVYLCYKGYLPYLLSSTCTFRTHCPPKGPVSTVLQASSITDVEVTLTRWVPVTLRGQDNLACSSPRNEPSQTTDFVLLNFIRGILCPSNIVFGATICFPFTFSVPCRMPLNSSDGDAQKHTLISKARIWIDGCFDFSHHGTYFFLFVYYRITGLRLPPRPCWGDAASSASG